MSSQRPVIDMALSDWAWLRVMRPLSSAQRDRLLALLALLLDAVTVPDMPPHFGDDEGTP